MGILNGLLTGGALIGKICQALGGSAGVKVFRDEASGVSTSGDVSTGGVKFFRSDSSGTSTVYAFNPDTKNIAQVVVPNEAGRDGVLYSIAPTQKVPFSEADTPLVPPTTEISAGLTNTPATNNTAGNGLESLFSLTFGGLKAGQSVNVGSFKLTCTTTQLLITSVAVVASMISYFYFHSDKGVSASNRNPILPNKQLGNAANGIQQSFDIDFNTLGIDMNNDTLDGSIQLSIAASATEVLKLSKVPSQPLHPAEQQFFSLLASGKL